MSLSSESVSNHDSPLQWKGRGPGPPAQPASIIVVSGPAASIIESSEELHPAELRRAQVSSNRHAGGHEPARSERRSGSDSESAPGPGPGPAGVPAHTARFAAPPAIFALKFHSGTVTAVH
jgi:hypothetical protein